MSETINKISFVFVTETGKSFTVSLNYAADTIPTSGTTLVQAFADYVLQNQPFSVTLTACEGAEYTETTTTDIAVTDSGGGA